MLEEGDECEDGVARPVSAPTGTVQLSFALQAQGMVLRSTSRASCITQVGWWLPQSTRNAVILYYDLINTLLCTAV